MHKCRFLPFSFFVLVALLACSSRTLPVAAQPLSQPAQNYFVESILNGVYDHAPAPAFFKEYRSDGLLTRGTARFGSNPVFCVVGLESLPAVQTSVEALLAEAVETLTAGKLQAAFLPAPCWHDAFPVHPGYLGCEDVPPDQITVFLWTGGGHAGLACHGNGYLPPQGGEITGGRVVAGLPSSENLTNDDKQTIRHELGHVFGLQHTWGDVNVMLYRSGRTVDFEPLEREAFTALYELPPGTGLEDLIDVGVIDDDPAVLNEAPDIEQTTISDQFHEVNHGAVWDDIFIWGQRLTLAFGSEGNTTYRPINYAPPVVTFGEVSIVPDLGDAYQSDPTSWFGAPAAVLKVPVPPGAGTPIYVTVRGQTATFENFTLDGDSVPYASSAPAPVVNLACERVHGGQLLAWALPSFFADAQTPLGSEQVLRRIFRNGVQIAELLDGLEYYDGAIYPPHEAHLYQVVLINRIGAQEGIPSTVCALPSELSPDAFTPTPTGTPVYSEAPTSTSTPTGTVESSATPSSTPTPTLTEEPMTATATRTSTATPTEKPLTATPTGSVTPGTVCTGDCDGGGTVTVNEITIMVNIALGTTDLSSCAEGDADSDGNIAINELVLAVNNALDGCL